MFSKPGQSGFRQTDRQTGEESDRFEDSGSDCNGA